MMLMQPHHVPTTQDTHLPVRLLDLLVGRRLVDLQDLVVVLALRLLQRRFGGLQAGLDLQMRDSCRQCGD